MRSGLVLTPTLAHQAIVHPPRVRVPRGSQSATSADSDVGRRYQRHREPGTHVLLFVRKRNADDRGVAPPYVWLGLAAYVRHEGERPMPITWRLRRPILPALFVATRLAAA